MTKLETKEQIYQQLVVILVEDFEVESDDISLEANLYTDLDLDSIDTVDLVIKLQEITGKSVNPETFKAVRTMQHVVDAVYDLVHD
ncbi:acyl carrier protein [Kangiella geojedonensis]|uniref:Phosphopantetheine-binding n=1 Tax=Kangiella geojedonensis TaxID=914150 RepID=A0A0F6RDB0_9GAMM|nr:acyl carrier protein [Kangiella geojedonensis]AKE53138.1 Phosphopantetheine-binding [Kangiella geojedonensis]